MLINNMRVLIRVRVKAESEFLLHPTSHQVLDFKALKENEHKEQLLGRKGEK